MHFACDCCQIVQWISSLCCTNQMSTILHYFFSLMQACITYQVNQSIISQVLDSIYILLPKKVWWTIIAYCWMLPIYIYKLCYKYTYTTLHFASTPGGMPVHTCKKCSYIDIISVGPTNFINRNNMEFILYHLCSQLFHTKWSRFNSMEYTCRWKSLIEGFLLQPRCSY